MTLHDLQVGTQVWVVPTTGTVWANLTCALPILNATDEQDMKAPTKK